MDLRPRDRVTIPCPSCEGAGELSHCTYVRACFEGYCGHQASTCEECQGEGSVEVAAEDVL